MTKDQLSRAIEKQVRQAVAEKVQVHVTGLTESLVRLVEKTDNYLAYQNNPHMPAALERDALRHGLAELRADIKAICLELTKVHLPVCDVCGSTDLQGTSNGKPCWRCGQMWLEAVMAHGA